MKGKGRMKKLLLVPLFLAASFLGPTELALADHGWENPCGFGEELRIEGFAAYNVWAGYRMRDTNDQEYYLENVWEYYGEGLIYHFIGEVRNVQSWERIAGVSVSAGNLHFAWIDCFDNDPDMDSYGPPYHGPYGWIEE